MGWIETCIKEVITLPETHLLQKPSSFFGTSGEVAISSENASATAEFFEALPPESADNIAAGSSESMLMRTATSAHETV